jgi:hypothetical protein
MRPESWTFWEGDEQNSNGSMWDDGTNFPENGLTRRHGKGASIARIDGGVEWVLRSEYDEEFKRTGIPTKLWCNPETTDGRQR